MNFIYLSSMVSLRYTCAYYKRPDMTRDEAQEAARSHRPSLSPPADPWKIPQAKMDLIAKKLDLKPGMPLGGV